MRMFSKKTMQRIMSEKQEEKFSEEVEALVAAMPELERTSHNYVMPVVPA